MTPPSLPRYALVLIVLALGTLVIRQPLRFVLDKVGIDVSQINKVGEWIGLVLFSLAIACLCIGVARGSRP